MQRIYLSEYLVHTYTIDFALKKTIDEIEPFLLDQIKYQTVEENSYHKTYNQYVEKGLKIMEKTPDELNNISKNIGLTYKSCLALPKAPEIKAQ
jgi:hypothetical protein